MVVTLWSLVMSGLVWLFFWWSDRLAIIPTLLFSILHLFKTFWLAWLIWSFLYFLYIFFSNSIYNFTESSVVFSYFFRKKKNYYPSFSSSLTHLIMYFSSLLRPFLDVWPTPGGHYIKKISSEQNIQRQCNTMMSAFFTTTKRTWLFFSLKSSKEKKSLSFLQAYI